MANEIEIRVTSKDLTDAGFASVDAKVRGMETRTGTSLGRIKEKFKKTGEESGTAFATETQKALEKGLAGAESKLAAARARLTKALTVGGGEISNSQRASIEYDIKLHESSAGEFRSKLKALGEGGGRDLGNGVDREGRGIFSRMVSSVAGIGSKIGTNLAEGASDGFSKMLPMIGGTIALPLAAILVTGVGAAIGLAVGAGIIGAGIFAAIKSDPSIGTAFQGLKARAEQSMKGFGAPFVAPVKDAIGQITSMLTRIDPSLRRIGASMAPLVASLVTGIGGLIERMMPGLERMTTALKPMFDQLKTELPQMGVAISSLFDSIAKAGPGEIKFFHDFISILDGTVVGMGKLIEGASGVYDWMDKFGSSINNAINPVNDVSQATDHLKTAQLGMAAAANRAALAIVTLTNRLVDSGLVVLSMRGAQRRFQESLDGVTASIKTNGRALDIGTAKGRANQTALDAIADSTFALYKAQQSAHGSQNTLNGTMQRGADASYKAARALGMTTEQAFAYTKSIYGIPPSKSTLVKALGAAKSTAEVKALHGEINSLTDKTITLTTRTVRIAQNERVDASGHRIGGFAHGGAVGAAASGGPRSGRFWVGEAGPELMDTTGGIPSRVYTAGDSRRMAGSGGRAAEVRMIIDSAGSRLDDLLVQVIRKAVRLEGGNVQKALGTT